MGNYGLRPTCLSTEPIDGHAQSPKRSRCIPGLGGKPSIYELQCSMRRMLAESEEGYVSARSRCCLKRPGHVLLFRC